MHDHSKENHKHSNEEECDCECDCCEQGESCNCSDCKDCYCGPSGRMEITKESADAMLTQIATDVWMKLFVEACEKEYKKQAGKNIEKLAKEHVKKAIKEWETQMEQ